MASRSRIVASSVIELGGHGEYMVIALELFVISDDAVTLRTPQREVDNVCPRNLEMAQCFVA